MDNFQQCHYDFKGVAKFGQKKNQNLGPWSRFLAICYRKQTFFKPNVFFKTV